MDISVDWSLRNPITIGTEAVPAQAHVSPADDVRSVVARILGYDPIEASLMAAGYREFAEESIAIAEGTIGVSIEALDLETDK